MAAAVKSGVETYDPARMKSDAQRKKIGHEEFDGALDGSYGTMPSNMDSIEDDLAPFSFGWVEGQAKFTAPAGQSWDDRDADGDGLNDRGLWLQAALNAIRAMVDRLWTKATSETLDSKTDAAYEVVGVGGECNLERGGWKVDVVLSGGAFDTHRAFLCKGKIDYAEEQVKILEVKPTAGEKHEVKTDLGKAKVTEDRAVLFVRYADRIYKGWGIEPNTERAVGESLKSQERSHGEGDGEGGSEGEGEGATQEEIDAFEERQRAYRTAPEDQEGE